MKFDRETRQEVLETLKEAFGKGSGKVTVTAETTKEQAEDAIDALTQVFKEAQEGQVEE